MSVQQEKFKAIADKIREKTGTTEKIKPNDFTNKIEEVYEKGYNDGHYIGEETGYEQGKTDEHSKMWDRIQRNGEVNGYGSAFLGYFWGWDNFYPKYDLNFNGGNGDRAFYNWKQYNAPGSLVERLNECGVKINTTGIARIDGMFGYSCFTEIPELVFVGLKNTAYMSSVFVSSQALITIVKITVDKNLAYTNWFTGCSRLANIRFEGEIGKSIDFRSCPLSKASIANIIEHLCTDTDITGQTLILSERAVNEAFGIDASDTTTWTEEWINLIKDKSNSYNGKWNISFV